MQEKNKLQMPPNGSSTLAHFTRPLGSQEMLFKKLLLCKKVIYSYKIPLKIYTQHRSLGKHKGTFHLSQGDLLWGLEHVVLSATEPVACWWISRERGFGWACPATQVAVPATSSFSTLNLLGLVSYFTSFSLKWS